MACEFIYPANQSVALNTPILFNDSIPCRRGNVYHADGEGVLFSVATSIISALALLLIRLHTTGISPFPKVELFLPVESPLQLR